MKKTTAYTLTTILLRAIAGGGLLAAILIAPNIAIALKPFLKQEDWNSAFFHYKKVFLCIPMIVKMRLTALLSFMVRGDIFGLCSLNMLTTSFSLKNIFSLVRVRGQNE
ncbi:MAG: hypothetical protein Q7R91_00505 [bacterium]|nr:hypothetical protein [bacterium]